MNLQNQLYFQKPFPRTKTVNLNDFQFLVGNFKNVCDSIVSKLDKGRSDIILPCSLNDFSSAYKNPHLTSAYRTVDIFTADGMPIVWLLNFKLGYKIDRVYGPDLMRYILNKTQKHKYNHYFITSSHLVLNRLRDKITNLFPAINIKRMIVFKDKIPKLDDIDPYSIIWIGIGSPKQVEVANQLRQRSSNSLIVCAGAAFELVSNVKPNAPQWMRNSGLEWLFRLCIEPNRLWKRYLIEIPTFLLSVSFSFLLKRSRSICFWTHK